MTRRHKTILQIDGVDEDSKYEGTGSEMDDISDDDNERSVEMDEEDEDDDESDDDSERNVKVVEMDEEDEDDDEYEAERVPVLIEDRDAEKIPVLIDDGCHASGVVIAEGNDLIKHVINDKEGDREASAVFTDEEVSHEAEKVPVLIEARDNDSLDEDASEDDDKHVSNDEDLRAELRQAIKTLQLSEERRCKLCPPGIKQRDILKHITLKHYSGRLLKDFPFIEGQICKMCNKGFTTDGIESHVGHVGLWHGKIIDVLPYDMLKMLKHMGEKEKLKALHEKKKKKKDEQKDDLKVLHEQKEDAIYERKEDAMGYGLYD